MRALVKSAAAAVFTAAVLVTPAVQQQVTAMPADLLFGTTGACNNAAPGGPCTQTSTLVQLDPKTGALIKEVGPVGYTVNGMAWDRKAQKLYASTAIGDVRFHGLITIDPRTGKGRPVDARVHNFGLAGADSPIHSITMDAVGRLAGWYDEFPTGQTTDTFVTLDPRTGIATELPDTGIDSSQNGLSYDEVNYLWNIDSPRPGGQTAYLIDPATGKSLHSVALSPPTPAAIGDFNPADNLYYGLSFQPFSNPPAPTLLVRVDPRSGAVTTIGVTVPNLHTLTFTKKDRG
jgi:hypothetical protein